METPREGLGSSFFNTQECVLLVKDYIEDPSNVRCPRCDLECGNPLEKQKTIEILKYFDLDKFREEKLVRIYPTVRYGIMVYCHGCGKLAYLRCEGDEDEDFEEEDDMDDWENDSYSYE